MGKLQKLLTGIALFIVASLAILFFVFKVSPIAWNLHTPINQNSGLALKGYDPVAYFTENKAVKGDTRKGIKWGENIFYFSSDSTKLMFKTFPEKYVPQYGGYCAAAVASGFTADVDPEVWEIIDNKLYLFFNQSARDDFISQIDKGIIASANSEWRNNN